MKKNILYLFSLAMLTAMSCGVDSVADTTSSTLSGSYAGMLTIGDNLYMISFDELNIMDVSDPASPVLKQTLKVSDNIESLFYNGDHLFVGSMEGMYIYSLQADGMLQFESLTQYVEFEDVLPCDPIVANDTLSFSTLSTSGIVDEGGCARWVQINELRVYDIQDVSNPVLLSTIEMLEPKGLGLDGQYLFVCEKSDGIRVFDISDPSNLELIHSFPGFSAIDLIPAYGTLLVVGKDSLHQFDYTPIDSMYKLSTFEIKD
jgi:hypothetical protein